MVLGVRPAAKVRMSFCRAAWKAFVFTGKEGLTTIARFSEEGFIPPC